MNVAFSVVLVISEAAKHRNASIHVFGKPLASFIHNLPGFACVRSMHQGRKYLIKHGLSRKNGCQSIWWTVGTQAEVFFLRRTPLYHISTVGQSIATDKYFESQTVQASDKS